MCTAYMVPGSTRELCCQGHHRAQPQEAQLLRGQALGLALHGSLAMLPSPVLWAESSGTVMGQWCQEEADQHRGWQRGRGAARAELGVERGWAEDGEGSRRAWEPRRGGSW